MIVWSRGKDQSKRLQSLIWLAKVRWGQDQWSHWEPHSQPQPKPWMDIHESSRVYLLHYTTLILGRIHIQSARCRFRKIAVNYVWTCDKCSLRPDMPVIWRLHTFCLTMCLVTQNRWYSLNLQSETRSGFRSRSIILKLRFGICPALDRVQWRWTELQQRVTSVEEDSRKAAQQRYQPTWSKPTTACRVQRAPPWIYSNN